MKDSQLVRVCMFPSNKYIKESNERFSTLLAWSYTTYVSISRRVMKDSQPRQKHAHNAAKYIKESNERFSTRMFSVILRL